MKYLINELNDNHPIKIYLKENILIKDFLEKLKNISIHDDFEMFFNIFNNLCEIEKHYVRKENQLFPFIEKYGWNTTTQYMWTFHDQIREELKEIRIRIEKKDFEDITFSIKDLIDNINHMILLEETTLFPNALNALISEDWDEISIGDKEVGYMMDVEYIHPKDDKKRRKIDLVNDAIYFEEGYLTPNQINLIFKYLPIDITYVDENDKVIFYNNGDERIFPRSPGIIGREVKFCHPPKSVDNVLKILEEFKFGTKDSAEFWINFKDSFIHIRFFAIRDKDRNYKGVMEITQNVSDIKSLEGERRILDWQS
jgi:DUF438 domain-containing protein